MLPKTRAICRGTIAIAMLILLVAVSACSPKTERVNLLGKKLPAKPDTAQIKLFAPEQPPECPYEVVGIVSSLKRNSLVSMEKVIETLRNEARKMGGDAVINVNLGQVETGSSGVNTKTGQFWSNKSNQPMLQGTIIRWVDPACSK